MAEHAVDDDAVGGDLLAGTYDDEVAHLDDVGRYEQLDAVAQQRRLLGALVEQGLERGAGAAAGPRLEVASEQDERDDRDGCLEVDLGARSAGCEPQMRAYRDCR
jgi:hypothetical protein